MGGPSVYVLVCAGEILHGMSEGRHEQLCVVVHDRLHVPVNRVHRPICSPRYREGRFSFSKRETQMRIHPDIL